MAVDLTQPYDPPWIPDPKPTRYFYNRDRQLDSIVRPDSVAVAFGYDTAGRPSTVRFDRGTLSYGYSTTTGNLGAIRAPSGDSLAFSYDGSLPTAVQWAGTVSGSVEVNYNSDFRVAFQTVNGADAVAFSYDRDGLLTGAGALTLSRSPTNGLLVADTLGSVASSYRYTTRGELAGVGVTVTGTGLFATSYQRDSLGRISALDDTTQGTPTHWQFVYDSVGRLVADSMNGAPFHAFTYDANGNRLSYTSSNGTITYSYDAQDRLLSAGTTTYTYGSNGELRTKTVPDLGTTTYRYDALGNLVTVLLPGGTRIDYVIDGQNRRVGRKVNGVLVQAWLYRNQLNPVAELDSSGHIVSRFVYGSRMSVPAYMVKNGNTYRIVADHLGSVRLIVDTASGAVAQRIDYDEWGNVTRNTNPGFQPFAYAGGLFDEDTHLSLFGARDYDAFAGRWTTKDPLGFAGASLSLYAYVASDPVNNVDPTGEWAGIDDLVFTAGGALIGLGGQFIGDLVSGNSGSWEDYVAAAVGGAVGGESLLYTGPVGSGALGAGAGNLTRQFLKLLSGKQCSFDLLGLGLEGLIGGLTGKIPGIPIPGLNAGRSNLNSIFNQMITKFESGQISQVSLQTALKMFVGQGVESLPGTGAGVAAGAAASGLLPSRNGCPCPH